MKKFWAFLGAIIFAIVFAILVRFFIVENIFVDVYPVSDYKECRAIQKDFTKFDVKFISWNAKTLQLKVRAKSIDTMVSYLPGYSIVSRFRNNNVSLQKEPLSTKMPLDSFRLLPTTKDINKAVLPDSALYFKNAYFDFGRPHGIDPTQRRKSHE